MSYKNALGLHRKAWASQKGWGGVEWQHSRKCDAEE